VRLLLTMFSVLLSSLLALPSPSASAYPAPERPVVLILAKGLSWETVEAEPTLREAFHDGGAATLSVFQGSTPPDNPRFSYVFIGAGSRVDTRFLPEDLPSDPGRIPHAFGGAARTVRPGSLGDALERAGVPAAAVGEEARLVVMDSEGLVPIRYGDEAPLRGLEGSLTRGAGLVAVVSDNQQQTAKLVGAARRAGAVVAVTSPSGSPQTPNLAPLALVRPGSEGGLLYSPSTRTRGLLTNADLAPTLLASLGAPVPPEMSGRVAETRPGNPGDAELLQRRLWFVEAQGFRVWAAVGVLFGIALAAGGMWGGRRGVCVVLLGLAGLPAGALLAAAVPVTGVAPVALLTALFAGGAAALSFRLSGGFAGALVLVALASAALVTLDAATGGALSRFSTLGYHAATGTRFYGIGNEYAAILAGGLTFGLGAASHRRRPPAAALAVVGGAVVLAQGLPTMGADVGGSLSLGLAFGATAGLARGGGLSGAALWAAGGFALAAALFLASGVLFPGVSHGSRAAQSGGGLNEILARKLEISLSYLMDPVLLALLVAGAAVIYAGWHRGRGTSLAAGIPGALIAALATGALNDSGLIATLFALIFPFAAAAGILLSKENATPP
jgi:hypothetical protein